MNIRELQIVLQSKSTSKHFLRFEHRLLHIFAGELYTLVAQPR